MQPQKRVTLATAARISSSQSTPIQVSPGWRPASPNCWPQGSRHAQTPLCHLIRCPEGQMILGASAAPHRQSIVSAPTLAISYYNGVQTEFRTNNLFKQLSMKT